MPKGGARAAARHNADWRSEAPSVAAARSIAAHDSEAVDSDLTGVQVRASAPVPPHRTNARHPLFPAIERWCYIGAGFCSGLLYSSVFPW